MNEGVVERCEDMCYTKYKFIFSDLTPEANNLFLLNNLLLIINSISMKKNGSVKWGGVL